MHGAVATLSWPVNSIHFRARTPHHRAPTLNLAFHQRAELLRRTWLHTEAEVDKALGDRRITHGPTDLGGQPAHGSIRCAGQDDGGERRG